MKQEDKTTIISYRLEQAQIALDDAVYLNAEKPMGSRETNGVRLPRWQVTPSNLTTWKPDPMTFPL